MLHRAFSVFLRDPSGKVLLQQRAAVKTRFPLRWGNTCCGHPTPGEETTVSAKRRLTEELGIEPVALREVGVYVYFATDPITGRVEREYDHVLLGEIPAGVEFQPDPGEVARLRWVAVEALLGEIDRAPEAYAPWLAGVTRQLAAASTPAASPHVPGLPSSSDRPVVSPVPGVSDAHDVSAGSEVTATERPGGQ
nr:hypothetical protein Ade03nite_43550 [Actinoplanes derwentensis]